MDRRFVPSEQSINAIQDCFNGYRDALLEQDGSRVVRFVTQATIDQYEFYREASLHAPATFLDLLSAMDCISVLRLRHSVPIDLFRSTKGADLLAYAVDNGWVGKESVASSALGPIAVFGDWAESTYFKDGLPSPVRARFVRAEDGWKFDLMHTMYQSGPAFESAIASDEYTRRESILGLLSQVLQEELDEALFEPLIP